MKRDTDRDRETDRDMYEVVSLPPGQVKYK
jgi:hypothetical protein